MIVGMKPTMRISASLLAGTVVAGLLCPPAVARQDDPRLDELFAALSTTSDPARAQATVTRIWEVWYESGDERIDRFLSTGRSAMVGGDFPKALASFDQAIAMDPEYAEAWNHRATLYYLIGNLEASAHDAERTIELEPRHFGALSGLGLIDIRSGKLEKAIEWFERALAVNPHARNARENIDWARRQLDGESRDN